MPHPSAPIQQTLRRACLVGLVLLLAATTWYIWRHHFIKAYSDPLNWLEYARDFRRQFVESKWPFGYPLFLAALLPLTGPVWIFLSNLPVLLLMTWTMASLTRRAAEGTGVPAPLAGLLAACFLVATNHGLLAYMANPYRDPLSYVLLLAGVLAFLRFAQDTTASPLWMALSGFCVGAGYCVRETSILLVPFLGLAGVAAWAENRSRAFWRPLLAFSAGLFLGILPFLVQGQLATGNAFKPVQSEREGKLVPGMHFSQIGVLLPHVAKVYAGKFTWAGVAAIGAGVWFLVRLRRWATLLVLAGPAAGYFVFYSFYYAYVPRYFFSTDLFFAPLAGLGAAGVMHAACSRLRLLRVLGTAPLLAPLAVIIALAREPAPRLPHFQTADAQRLARDLAQHLPAGATVLCDRNLCEIIRWLAPVHAFPAEGLTPGGPIHAPGFGTEEIRRRLNAGTPVYAVKILAPRASQLNALAALEFHDLLPVWSFAARDFNLAGVLGRSTVELFRVQPWSVQRAELSLPAPGSGIMAIRLSGRELWRNATRTFARLSVNGLPLDDRVENGLNQYPVPETLDPAAPWTFELVSDRPVPRDLTVDLLREGQPVVYQLGVDSDPEDSALLGEGLAGVSCLDRSHRLMGTHAVLRLPVWQGTNSWLATEVEFRMLHRLDMCPPATLLLSAPGSPDTAREAPYDRQPHSLLSVLHPQKEGLEWIDLSLTLSDIPLPPHSRYETAGVELDRVVMIPVPKRPAYRLHLADVMGDPFRVSGFHAMEKDAQGIKTIWSKGQCALDVWLTASSDARQLRLTGFDRRPPRAPAAAPSARWNGRDIPISYTRREDGSFELLLTPPAGVCVDGANRLVLSCTAWIPARTGVSRDARELGLLWAELEVRPAPQP